jgi:Peroxidase
MTFLHHHGVMFVMITTISTLLIQSQQVHAHPHYLLRRTTEQQEETNDHARTLLDSSPQQQQAIIPQLKADIKALIDANPALAPKFVRLTFHDCVGGCNGCVDMTNVSLPSVLVLVYQNTACCVLRVAVLVVLRTFLLLFFLLFGAAYTHTIT